MSARNIKLNQALHGYHDGHRLLEASCNLPIEADRLMLIMSDMSGPNMVHGFESYLTGYPIKEINSYVLARTWYAPEMERPGCVWTHSLIIANADLAQITNLSILLDIFNRPSHNSKLWEPYSRLLPIPAESIPLRAQSPELKLSRKLNEIAKQVIQALYGSPHKQVFLPLETTSVEYEQLTVALWTQQWAKMRRAFKFCTGSIMNRKLPNGEFDWQIIPFARAQEIRRAAPNAIFLNSDEEDSPAWVKTVVEDLSVAQSSPLRKFLRSYGVETSKGRADFAPLVQIFAAYQEVRRGRQSLKDLINAVARLFPSSDKGARLKTSLFGSHNTETARPIMFPRGLSESEILNELAQTENYAAFDGEALQISNRATNLLGKNFTIASSIAYSLLGRELTPLGEKFIDGFCEGLIAQEAFEHTFNDLNVVYSLLKRKPMLMRLPVLWRGSPAEQRKIMAFINRNLKLDSEATNQLIRAMLGAGSDAVARDIAYKYPKLVVDTVLNWCNSKSIEEAFNLGIEWRRVLANHPDLCIKWMNGNNLNGESTMALISFLLDPHSRDVIRGGAKIWTDFAKQVASLTGDEFLGTSLCFLLALGFNNPDSAAVTLVIHVFEPVHKMAEQNSLSEENWQRLKYQAPTISWGGDWDKCERLMGALIEHFIRFRWPKEDFLLCVKNPSLLKKVVSQVLTQGTWFNRHYTYIKKVSDQVLAGKLSATKAQRDILAEAFYIT